MTLKLSIENLLNILLFIILSFRTWIFLFLSEISCHASGSISPGEYAFGPKFFQRDGTPAFQLYRKIKGQYKLFVFCSDVYQSNRKPKLDNIPTCFYFKMKQNLVLVSGTIITQTQKTAVKGSLPINFLITSST